MVFPIGIGVAEIFPGHRLRQNHRFRMRKDSARITLHQWQRNDLEEIRIHYRDAFREMTVAHGYRHIFKGKPGGGTHFRNLVPHRQRQRHWCLGQRHGGTARRIKSDFNAIKLVAAGKPFVIGQFVPNKKHDQDYTGQTYRQPCDIDEAVELVPDDVAQRDGEIVAEHGPLYS